MCRRVCGCVWCVLCHFSAVPRPSVGTNLGFGALYGDSANSSGFLDVAHVGRYGLVSVDWSNAHELWFNGNASLESCEELLVAQGMQLRMVNPKMKYFVYRNFELGLEWMSSQRALMRDEAAAGLFLRYENGTIYDEPRAEGSQYFWNYSNPQAVKAWVDEIAGGALGVGNEWVDGVFTDGVTGIPAEHPNVIKRLNLTASQVQALQTATGAAYDTLLHALIEKGAYNWQAFGAQDGATSLPSNPAQCQEFLSSHCSNSVLANQPVLWGMQILQNGTYAFPTQNIAIFLVVRGDFHWIGTGWGTESHNPNNWTPYFDLDVGSPTTNCKNPSPGVFERSWSNGVARIDCSMFNATLEFPKKA